MSDTLLQMSDTVNRIHENVSAFAQPDRSIARVNAQYVAAPVDLAVHVIVANSSSSDHDRHIQINMPVASVNIDIRG